MLKKIRHELNEMMRKFQCKKTKTEQSLRITGEIIKKSNVCIIGVIQVQKRDWAHAIFKGTMAKKFPKLLKDINHNFKKVIKPQTKTTKKTILRHVLVKLLKTKD